LNPHAARRPHRWNSHSSRFLISYASPIHTVDTYVKSAIFFGACLVVILVIGLTMKRDREEDPESSRGYGDTSDDGLEGLAQMEN
jgi:hypothetical protein